MKSLNIKIPINMMESLSDRGQLNPSYMTGFIVANLSNDSKLLEIEGLTTNYTFKIDKDLHTKIKLHAIGLNLNMNDLIGRLLQTHYKG